MKTVDMTGLQFGCLTILSQAPSSRAGKARWNVLCACGKQCVMAGDNIRNSKTQSCGCVRQLTREHKKPIADIAFIPLGNGRFSQVDLSDYHLANIKWYIDRTGYARNRRISALHEAIVGRAPQGKYVDHINGDRLDNRRANLRFVDFTESCHNSGLRRDNTSGFKGVSYSDKERKWIAQHNSAGKLPKRIGCFGSPVEAAHAYDVLVRSLYGVVATFNFPKAGERHA